MKLRGFLLFLLMVASLPLFGQAGAVVGKVYNSQAQPVADATVTLVELRRSVKSGPDGSYRFDNVPPGHYHVQAESTRFGTAIGEAEVERGQTRTVEVVVDPAMHAEEIVVTASADARTESEVYQPIEVVGEEELAERMQPTLGETLNEQPGVNSTYFGPGASRPVIRGLGADRIRILEDGVGTGDVSSASPDHAVTVDPANAEQIEIVRGPATLLYGSNAVGGVVNVIDNRVPNRVPTDLVTGRVDLRLGSVADERSGTLSLFGGRGPWAWQGNYTARNTDDYEIPGPADEHDDPAEFEGFLENSALENRSGTFGASYVASRGYFGVAYSLFDSLYGVPGHEHHEDGEVDEEHTGVVVDMRQRRFDVKGELSNLGFFNNVRLRVGTNDYQHQELEGDEVGTEFRNDTIEARLEATHRPFGALRGSMGVQWMNSDFVAAGEEAFLAPNETSSRAVFAFEELTSGRWDFQFGARYESQDLRVEGIDMDRSFEGVSGSLGTIVRLVDGLALAASLARAVRLPNATELFANGPHAATAQFEVGNPSLNEETALGIDVSLRKTAGRFRGVLNVFQNYFDGYIFEAPTGEEIDELPVFAYQQADARFRGIEVDTHTELWHAGERHIELEAGADLVNATLENGGGNLPRIPPVRFSFGLRYEGGPFNAWAEARRYFDQDDVAAYEEPTEGYTMVNAAVGYRFFLANTVHDVMLRGTNLTDELARVHTSPLKERAPLPGRDWQLSYRLTF